MWSALTSSFYPRAAKGSSISKAIHACSFLVLLCALLVAATSSLASQEPLKVGIYQNPPKVFIDENGLPRGIYVDLLNQIAQKAGWRIRYVPCTWQECLDKVAAGKLDLVVDVASTPARQAQYAFTTEPILRNWGEIFTPTGNEVSSFAELKGKTIAVLDGGIHGKVFGKLSDGLGIACKTREVKSYDEAFRLVGSGQADAAVVNNIYGIQNAHKYGLVSTHIVFSPVDLHIIANKAGATAALDTIDNYIASWKKDQNSPYHESLGRWVQRMQPWKIPQWAYGVMVAAAVLLAFLSVSVLAAKRIIKTRTAQLSESEELFRQAFENANTGACLLDLQGRVIQANKKLGEILGYEPQELEGKSAQDLTHPEDRGLISSLMERSLAGELEGVTFESRFLHKESGVVWAQVSSPLVRDAKGGPLFFLPYLTDITDRKRAEEALRQKEHDFHLFFENSVRGVALLEAIRDEQGRPVDFRYLNVNNAFEKHSGLSREQVLGRTVRETVPSIEPVWIETLGRVADTDQSVNFEECSQALNRIFEVAAFRMEEDKIALSFSDITEEKRREEALRQSEEIYRLHFENSSDLIFIWDENLTLLKVSASVEDLLGFSPGELEGKFLSQLPIVKPADAERAGERLRGVMRREKPGYAVYELMGKDGRSLFFEASSTVAGEGERKTGMVTVARDITQRKQDESRLQHLNRLYATLSGVNHAIVGAKEPDELFGAVCQVAVDTGGLSLAWIGLVEPETGLLKPVSSYGAAREQLPSECIDLGRAPFKNGLMGKALNSGHPEYNRDIQQDPGMEQWRQLASAGELHSAAAVPFSLNGQMHGMLNLFATDVDFFAGKGVHDLLEEIGGDISYALDKIKTEAKRARAESETNQKNKLLAGINKIFLKAVRSETEEALGRKCLAVAEELTGSEFGFIAEINPKGLLDTIALSDPGWQACRMGVKEPPKGLETGGLYGRVLKDGKGFFTNDPSSHPDWRGLPPGHPPLTAFLGTPLLQGGEVIGMIAVGNREGGYGRVELESLEALAGAMTEALMRTRSEKAQRESEQKFLQVMETTNEVWWMADSAFSEFLHVSPAFERVWGRSCQSLYDNPRSFFDAVHPEDRERMLSDLEVQKLGQPFDHEYRIVQPDGEVRHIWERGFPVADESGQLIRYAGVAQDITERKQADERLQKTLAELEQAMTGTVNVLTTTLDKRDPYTAGHQRRVAELACAIAEEMGWPRDKIEGLRLGGMIHDLGKIAVPSDILSKPGKITSAEFQVIQSHTTTGDEILRDIPFPWPIADVVLQHHERMDGTGYPQGLSGEEIIPEARIMAVADVVEAMASHRPYRPALSIDVALGELQEHSERYDPEVVEACLRLFREKGYQLS